VSGSAFTINSGTVNLSPEGFYFASSTVLYVADTGDPKTKGVGDGGIQKWTLNVNSGVWSLAYTITSPNFLNPTTVNPTSGNGTAASSGETGLEAITGEVVNGVAQLYAVSYTAGDDNANGLYGLSDTLSATTPTNGEQLTELAEAPGGTSSTSYNFKGVSFAPVATPEPSTWVLLGAAFAGLAWFHRRRQQA
jgi:hypothetical protein